jgi:succinyl-CoA synthetase beta subunit
MAKLHEYQGKALLERFGIAIPRGALASSPDEAQSIAVDLGGAVVIKAQVWITGRADRGAIRFAADPDEAAQAAADVLGMRIGQFTVEQVLVEERLAVDREFYAGVIVDDVARAPVVIFSSVGGTGVEQIVPDHLARHVVNIQLGLRDFEARELARRTGIHGQLLLGLGDLLPRLYDAARTYDARAAEINPLVLTGDGRLVAADCRFTIDDYAVFRHPNLDIPMARELDHPPTRLERIAWEVERDDYRGTFFFIQMEQDFRRGEGVIGFHGAGGGGGMMSMDAVQAQSLRIANFVDTSGNPPASKVYRAARLILRQTGIDGYFASGSGVASQEQYHSARALVKAFMEAPLTVPAVIRLGGNAEDQAIAILERARNAIPAPVEAYGKDDRPDFCAGRLRQLIDTFEPPADPPARYYPVPAAEPYAFETVTGGVVTLDHARCRECASKVCVTHCAPQILTIKNEVPVLNISRETARRGDCTECLACEVECYFEGNRGGYVYLPIPEVAGGDSD